MNSNVAFVWPPCSTLLNARMPTKLTLRVSVSVEMIYCLYWLRALPRECSSYSVENEQSLESLAEEKLNISDLSSNRKRKGKGVSETVRPGIERRWSDEEVDGLRIVGRFLPRTLKSSVASNMSYWFGHLVQPALCNIVQQCWTMLQSFGRALRPGNARIGLAPIWCRFVSEDSG